MNKVLLGLGILVVIGGGLWAASRPAAVAGGFYPADKQELAYQVDKLLLQAPAIKINGRIIALIVPHAGYQYSGGVAAAAYKQIQGQNFKRIILLGSSHRAGFDTIAAPDFVDFATPLGKVPVDRDFIKRLRRLTDKVEINNDYQRAEHALEVPLPFLQTVLQDFQIVPLLFGKTSLANCQALAYALSFLLEDDDLILASSDWSHYYSDDIAKRLDNKGIAALLTNQPGKFVQSLADGETEACGAPAIITTALLAPALGANKVELLKAANSGDITGDKSRVVGYAALAYIRQEYQLAPRDKQELLKIARKTLEAKLNGRAVPEFKFTAGPLAENRGAFVTLKKKGELRGCLGYIQPTKPLYQVVQEMAVEAATNDSRFPAVQAKELREIKMEISALSRLIKVKDIAEIKVGRDGLYLIKEGKAGLLLPQVPVEWGWDRTQFLAQVSLKAGLASYAWNEPGALLYRFSAEVFAE